MALVHPLMVAGFVRCKLARWAFHTWGHFAHHRFGYTSVKPDALVQRWQGPAVERHRVVPPSELGISARGVRAGLE